ncbi:AroK Shikimate kinase [Candidatus Nanopelagicaceae bacterium]|jgi:shikimate kinase
MSEKVILIGPPGAGKSTIGNALAKKMKVKFADTDALIEAKLEKKISDIFVDLGEPFFREEELKVLAEVLVSDNGVISLGGGAPISLPAQELLRNSGSTVIFLDISLGKAAARVGFNRDRPLLLGNPRAQWTELMNARRPIYESLATAVIPVDDRSINEICADILVVA